jgi:hypothetical protein
LKISRKEIIDGPTDPGHPGGPIGAVYGNVSPGSFKCIITDPNIREMDYIEVYHPSEEWILGLVDRLELRSDLGHEDAARGMTVRSRSISYRRIAEIKTIGRRDQDGRLRRPLTPVLPSSNVYTPDFGSICSVLGLGLERDQGAYLGKLLHTDVDVVLHPSRLVQNHVSIIAKSGSGKSYACGVLTEELHKHSIPVVILDLHGEYRSMLSPNLDRDDYDRMNRFGVSPSGLGDSVNEFHISTYEGSQGTPLGLDIRSLSAEDLLDLMGIKNLGAGSSVMYNAYHKAKDILGDELELSDIIASVQADPNPAKWNILNGLEHLYRMPVFRNPPVPLGQIVSKGRVSVIELGGSPLDVQQAGVAALLIRLFKARKEGVIPPFMLVVEEAHNFCPQTGPAITSKVLRTVASEGRKFGMGLTVVSQRPAKVDKNVLSQCGTQVILKVTNPNDLKAVISSVEGLTTRMAEEVQRLPVAVAIVVGGSLSEPILVEIRTRMTKHGGGAVDIMGDLDNGAS